MASLVPWLGRAVAAIPDAVLSRLAGAPVQVRGRRLDPRLALMAKSAASQTPLHRMTPAEARVANKKGLALGAGVPRRMAEIEHRTVRGAEGELAARLYRPPGLDGPRPLLLYFHQGGCVIGDLDWCEPFCTRLAERARCLVLAASYRLGPEHRFPAAQEDAVAIHRWVLAHAESLGADPARIAVGGDSAGGGLSACITHAARRSGDPQPLVQLLVYPWLHAYADNDAYRDFTECWPLDPRGMAWFLSHYLNNDAEREDPRLSPVLEESFDGLAPAIIASAGFDPLCDEAAAYARKLEDAGVPVWFRCYDELCHSFTVLGGAIPAADRALDEIADELERALTDERGLRV